MNNTEKLNVKDLQEFIQNIRNVVAKMDKLNIDYSSLDADGILTTKKSKKKTTVKYFAIHEYGTKTNRKHWHILTFNFSVLFNGSLCDYLGLPIAPTAEFGHSLTVSAMPLRAYQLIYNEYYRDQNLQEKVAVTGLNYVSDAELGAISVLRKRAWEKDYFTSCLPWVQRGPDVPLPIDTTVQYKDVSTAKNQNGSQPLQGAVDIDQYGFLADDQASSNIRIENIDHIVNDVTINELRRANALQKWLEKSARGGSRYVEMIWQHFVQKSSDGRLQRPEYIGGGVQPIVISEVLSATQNADADLGTMAGHGISVGSQNRFKTHCEEHGYIMGIMSILPKTTYACQGVPKHFLKTTKFDYYWPDFAHLGEQEVLNKELYMDFVGNGENDAPFGYQSRYAEYKFNQSSVHGDFRDNLAYWHMARFFDATPDLNEEFIKSNPTHDIFAVTDPSVHKLYVQLYHDLKAIRPIPIFATPKL